MLVSLVVSRIHVLYLVSETIFLFGSIHLSQLHWNAGMSERDVRNRVTEYGLRHAQVHV